MFEADWDCNWSFQHPPSSAQLPGRASFVPEPAPAPPLTWRLSSPPWSDGSVRPGSPSLLNVELVLGHAGADATVDPLFPFVSVCLPCHTLCMSAAG